METGFPWAGLATEITLCVVGLLLVTMDTIITDPKRKHVIGYFALGGLLLSLLPASGVFAQVDQVSLFNGVYVTDTFHTFFRVVAILTGALVVLLSFDYLEHIRIDRGIYFTLLVFAVLAMVLLAGANDLIMIYLSVEYLSISSYLLVGYLMGRDRGSDHEAKRSSEASLKYLIFGAVASGAMLYGFSLMYGFAGSTSLEAVRTAFAVDVAANLPLKFIAVGMVVVGLGFKLGAAPFHQWAPDVYEGAPTPVSAFLAVGSKAATVAVVARFFVVGMEGFGVGWHYLLIAVAVTTMFAGNLLAILQTNLKRMLGYSSVAHAGYMLTAVVAAGLNQREGLAALLFYLAVYVFMNLGAFAVVIWLRKNTGSEAIEDLAGLGRKAPGIAVAMLIFMLALTGLPPTSGFIGKVYLLNALVGTDYWWLGAAIVINSVISAFYYINVVRVMWITPPRNERRYGYPTPSTVIVYLCAAATVLFGVWFGVLRTTLENTAQIVGG